MNLNFESLEQIPTIYKLLLQINEKIENKVEKRWLSTIETANYLGYSKDSIDSMIKKGELISGIHYYQRERKRMFDKEELDNWVRGITNQDNKIQKTLNLTIEEITSSIAA